MIISRTPFRISFFGGGTDYPVWYQENSGAVLGVIGGNDHLNHILRLFAVGSAHIEDRVDRVLGSEVPALMTARPSTSGGGFLVILCGDHHSVPEVVALALAHPGGHPGVVETPVCDQPAVELRGLESVTSVGVGDPTRSALMRSHQGVIDRVQITTGN